MKLMFAVLCVSLNDGLTHCYKTTVFLQLYLQFVYLRCPLTVQMMLITSAHMQNIL